MATKCVYELALWTWSMTLVRLKVDSYCTLNLTEADSAIEGQRWCVAGYIILVLSVLFYLINTMQARMAIRA